MQNEIEIKFRINKDKREKIISEFKEWEKMKQKDVYYKSTHDQKGVLRIREQGENKELCYKWFLEDKEGWGEIETPIKCNSNSLIEIFKKIGYKKDIEIKKERMSTRTKNNIEINIDKIEGLGDFCELEVINGNFETLNKLAKRFGITKKEITKEGYVQLLKNK